MTTFSATPPNDVANCPFCDSSEVSLHEDTVRGFFYVKCGDCGALGPVAKSYDDAYRSWSMTASDLDRVNETCKKLGFPTVPPADDDDIIAVDDATPGSYSVARWQRKRDKMSYRLTPHPNFPSRITKGYPEGGKNAGYFGAGVAFGVWLHAASQNQAQAPLRGKVLETRIATQGGSKIRQKTPREEAHRQRVKKWGF